MTCLKKSIPVAAGSSGQPNDRRAETRPNSRVARTFQAIFRHVAGSPEEEAGQEVGQSLGE